ncbi:MAG: quinone oxidoreductase [Anaerolineae bacterium]|jgi:NADPH2:quinone reductase|nr:quinone oxidoreductase [Anaerolineae bacterium]
MKAICIHEFGGPEVLRYEDVAIPEPGPGEVRIKIEAAGVNYVDTYHRTGSYKGELPITLGMEGAGTVDALGAGVTSVRHGDQVAYAMTRGSYAEYAVVPESNLARVPRDISAREAAAVILQGMTAHFLATSTFVLHRNHVALIHAAAGGVGGLLVQMAKRRGARVIATCSTEEKAARVRRLGADEVILYSQVDFETEAKRLTDGIGVHVVYDGVGQATFMKSLNCLRRRGMMVLFGAASGPVPPLDPQVLNTKGSLFLTRPTLSDYVATRERLQRRAGDVFAWMSSGELEVPIDRTFPLAEAAEAHRYIEGRKTLGKLLLTP